MSYRVWVLNIFSITCATHFDSIESKLILNSIESELKFKSSIQFKLHILLPFNIFIQNGT
jgi:hypothetical protein